MTKFGQNSRIKFIVTFCLVLSFVMAMAVTTSATQAQAPAGVYTPQRGNPERRAILDAVRPIAERDLGVPVEFVVAEFNVSGDWAFVALNSQRPGGRPIDPNSTPFVQREGEEAIEMFDCCHVEAILRRSQGSWQVIQAGVGATDLWLMDWCQKTPPGLIEIC